MARKVSWLSASRYSWFVVVGAVLAGKDACLGGAKRPADPVRRVAPTASAVAPTPPTPPQNLPPPG